MVTGPYGAVQCAQLQQQTQPESVQVRTSSDFVVGRREGLQSSEPEDVNTRGASCEPGKSGTRPRRSPILDRGRRDGEKKTKKGPAKPKNSTNEYEMSDVRSTARKDMGSYKTMFQENYSSDGAR